MSSPPALLSVRGARKTYPGVVALRGADLTVERGEVHGLLGENGAGKSTLARALLGLTALDSGRMELDGRPFAPAGPREALRRGVGMVHQHFQLVPDLTVAENVALGLDWPRLRRPRLAGVARRVTELAERYGLRVDPTARAGELSVGARQRVELLKLLYRQARLLVLDEPTAVLTPPEWQGLAAGLRALAAEGRGVVLITHKLDEVLDIADGITVLRGGAVAGRRPAAGASKPALARLMIGRDTLPPPARPPMQPGRPVVELRGVEVRAEDGRPLLRGVDLAVREREIVGVAGVDGNGQRELAEVVTGVRRADRGELLLAGRPEPALSPAAFARLGGAWIPEDRHRDGAAPSLTIVDNLLLRQGHRPPFARRGLLDRRAAAVHADRLLREYAVTAPGPQVRLRQLSGGNQQKIVLARELDRQPRMLVAAQPTRGLDVAAAAFVHRGLLAQRARGVAILLLSTELDEILALSDRIAVLAGGRVVAVLGAGEADPTELGLLLAGERR